MKHLKTPFLLLLLLSALAINTQAQTTGWQWVQHGGGDGYPGSTSSNPGKDRITAHAIDKDGNLIVGGYCSWSPVFDTISFPNIVGSNWGFPTFFVAKYDANGNVLWVNYAGGNSVDLLQALDVDEAGNIYIYALLSATGTATLRFVAQDVDTIIANSNKAFIKFSPDGNLLLLKNYYVDPQYGWDIREGFLKYLGNGKFVALIDVQTIGGNANIGQFSAYDNSRNLALLDTFGNVIKLTMIDTLDPSGSIIASWAIDKGNIYFNIFNSNQPQVSILGTVINPAPANSLYLVKTDTTFILKDINTSGYNAGGLYYLSAKNGNLYASDRSENGATFDTDTVNGVGLGGVYTVYKIDSNLNLQWVSRPTYSEFFPYDALKIAVGNSKVFVGSITVGDIIWGGDTIDGVNSTYTPTFFDIDPATGYCSSSIRTTVTTSSTSGDYVSDIFFDDNDNLYAIGNFSGLLAAGSDSVYSNGGANSPDYFIIKWSDTVPTVVCSSAITRSNTDSLYTFNANATGTGALSYQWSNNGSAFSTNAAPQLVLDNPGTYNICVTVTDANNCTTTHCDTITITAATCNTVINAQNTDSAYTFTTTNTGIGPYSYAWSNNGTAFSSSATANVVLSTAGTYNICVTVTGSNNCQSSQCYSVTVTAPSCAAHYTLYADTSTPHDWWALNQASGTGTLTYQWSWGDGSNSTGATPSHTYASAGNYNICLTITDSTGCTDTYCDSSTYIYKAESMVTVNAVTQLPTTTATGDILYQRLNGVVFPNPATTQAQLLFTVNHDQAAEFTVTDSKGSLVSRRTIQFRAGKNLYNFRTAEWASGVYLITIQNEELKWSSRLVKE